MARRLTEKFIAGLKPGPRRDIWDTVLKGFGVRVSASGLTYVVRYRTRPAPGSQEPLRRVRYTVGPAGPAQDDLALERARGMARVVLGRVAEGQDPGAQRAERRVKAENTETFEELAKRMIAKADLGKQTRYNWERILDARVYPKLGKRVPSEIERRDVRELVENIAKETPVQANDTLKVVRWVFARALEDDIVTTTPCVGVRKPTKEQPRDRVATDAELRGIWNASENEGLYGQAMRLALLTAARREEAFSARWQEFDLEQKLWRIPGSRTKNAAPHEVPLTDTALDLVRALLREGEWVFAGRVEGQALRPTSKGWTDLLKAAELVGAGITFHDLRRTVRDRLTRDLGVAAPVAEAVIGHIPPRLIRTYNPSGVALKDKRTALERWERKLKNIVTQKAVEKTDNLVTGAFGR